MSGVFSIAADGAAGMYRLRQTARPWDDDGKASSLAEKAENGAMAFSLDPDFVRGAVAAKTAMEEAKRIAGPKAAAEDRLAQAEKRLKEIRQEARLAAARGDREKLAALAREAAVLARQAGRAAKDYAAGVSAAAEMGVGGDESRAAGGGATLILSSTSIQSTTTTVQLRQVEISVSLTIAADSPATAGGGATQSAVMAAAQSVAQSVGAAAQTGDGAASVPAEDGRGVSSPITLPSDLRFDGLSERVRDGLASSGQAIGGFNGAEGRRLLRALINDNELKASRYKEADAFARRVENALGTAKSVIGEAKAANLNEPDSRRRAERRKMFDELEKDLTEARDAVADLRGAAFGSAAGLLTGAVGGGADATAASVAPVASTGPVVNITA